jgi:hypothetical protein
MSYKVLLWTLAALLVVGVVAAVDLYGERREAGTVFIASNGPVTEEQVRRRWLEQRADCARGTLRDATSRSWDPKINGPAALLSILRPVVSRRAGEQ